MAGEICVIGRDDECRAVICVLARRKNKDPVSFGNPGVGKLLLRKVLSFELCMLR